MAYQRGATASKNVQTCRHTHLADEVQQVGTFLKQRLGEILALVRIVIGESLLRYVLQALRGMVAGHPGNGRLTSVWGKQGSHRSGTNHLANENSLLLGTHAHDDDDDNGKWGCHWY